MDTEHELLQEEHDNKMRTLRGNLYALAQPNGYVKMKVTDMDVYYLVDAHCNWTLAKLVNGVFETEAEVTVTMTQTIHEIAGEAVISKPKNWPTQLTCTNRYTMPVCVCVCVRICIYAYLYLLCSGSKLMKTLAKQESYQVQFDNSQKQSRDKRESQLKKQVLHTIA